MNKELDAAEVGMAAIGDVRGGGGVMTTSTLN